MATITGPGGRRKPRPAKFLRSGFPESEDSALARLAASGLASVPDSAIEGGSLISPARPLESARAFVAACHRSEDGLPLLVHHDGGFLGWKVSAWSPLSDDAIRAAVWRFLAGAQRWDEDWGEARPFYPRGRHVAELVDALRAETHLDPTVQAPTWLDGRSDPPAAEILPCANGLLHFPSGRLLKPTPAFFGLSGVSFNFDPSAPEPKTWKGFLRSVWPDDDQAINCLREYFGYCLSGETEQQKAALLIGPKRSGKGTIGRVLAAVMGQDHVVGPTLASLAGPFGLAPLIGKRLAIIADARLAGGRIDRSALAEAMLAISGEDRITIDRKHKPAWTGRLPTRFVVMANELPGFGDAAAALVSRFLVLVLTRSFYGTEDLTLADRLMEELPGILNWAISGWLDLQDRGRFVQPDSGQAAIEQLEDLASPVLAFVRQRCILEPSAFVEIGELWDAWRAWCSDQGVDRAGSRQRFGRDLSAGVPGLRIVQTMQDGRRFRDYQGIRLRTPEDDKAAQ